MDVIFTSSDLEQNYFNKQNTLFNRDSETEMIEIIINNFRMKINRNMLIKNFDFFLQKFEKNKNKNQCILLLNYLDSIPFMSEDIEFLKNRFFHFLNFLFTNETSQTYKINIAELIKFIEICIIFEPKNLIIDKIHKIIYLNNKIKTALQANSNRIAGRFINDKLEFLMQNLQNLKNMCKSNPINRLEKANLNGLDIQEIKISKITQKSNSKNSSLNSSFELNSSIRSASNGNFNLNKSSNNYNSLLNFNSSNTSNLYPKFKNSIFFRYSFNLIRHLYDLPIALNLNKKCLISAENNISNPNFNINNYVNNFTYNHFTNIDNQHMNKNNLSEKSLKNNKEATLSTENDKFKTFNNFNRAMPNKSQTFSTQISNNTNWNDGMSCGQTTYFFRNSTLEEETRNHFSRKSNGFFIFVDSLFKNQNSFSLKEYDFNRHQIKISKKDNYFGMLPNKNYMRSNDSTTTVSELNKNNVNLNDLTYSFEEYSRKESFAKISHSKNAYQLNKNFLENIFEIGYSEKNKELNRYFLMKNLQSYNLRCEKAIFIQKYIRRYLAYRNYLLEIKGKLKFRFNSCIQIIQSYFRSFISRKKFKYDLLLEEILRKRLSSSIKIMNTFRKFHIAKRIKHEYLLVKLIKMRRNSVILIQRKFRGFLFRKFFNELLNKEKHYFKLTYPFKADKVKLKLFIPRNVDDLKTTYEVLFDEKILDFEFCKFQKTHVLYIDNKEVHPGKYRALMVVDGIHTCDGRFPHVEFSDGYYYNIIDIKENKYDEQKIKEGKNLNNKNKNNLKKYGKINENSSQSFYNNYINNTNCLRNSNKYINNANKNNKKKGYDKDIKRINSNNERVVEHLVDSNFNYLPKFFSEGITKFENADNIYNNNNYFNNNYLNNLNESYVNQNTGTSFREELLETRNTYENNSNSLSKNNSQKTNNSGSINNNLKKIQLNKVYEISDQNKNEKDEFLDNNMNEYTLQNNNNSSFNNLANISNINNRSNEKQESQKSYNSYINDEEFFTEDWIVNFNELKKNLLPDSYNTKTISYIDKIEKCLREENDIYDFDD